MKLSNLFTKTSKQTIADEPSINAQYLMRWGFVHREMAGVYTFLPMGLRVLNKIESIIRRHIDTIGNEILMPALCPKENWIKSGRRDTVDVLMKTSGANEASKNKSTNEYALCPTHEDIVTPLLKDFIQSHKDLPRAVYQIQTKYRNEARAKSWLLRGREFRMKDLYSFHATTDDLYRYYEQAKIVYKNIFDDLGIGKDTFITVASGGDFTSDFSHEFQTLCDVGEDEIYLDRANNIAYNKEVVNEENEKKFGIKFSDLEVVPACEVGNIFPLHTKFSEAFDLTYTDTDNSKKTAIMWCYGIWPSRIMGVIVEKCHDDKGIIWPKEIAPFQVLIICAGDQYLDQATLEYETRKANGEDIALDDRDMSFWAKMADRELRGIPEAIIIGKNGQETKLRA
jgi:prolyl-tRNA synthetase